MTLPSPPLGLSPDGRSRPPLASVLPPLVLGTATFNTQYVDDPTRLPCNDIVSRAFELGITAFDTSPYYGPSEVLLGSALAAVAPGRYDDGGTRPFLITKAGRVGPFSFDYSPQWIRRSIRRSLARLHAPQLDLVYTHDVEFVSEAAVLEAVRELRRLRDEEGLVRYVGISGYPVDVLCELAEAVLRETGEPIDAVLSYGHFTIQNRILGRQELDDLAAREGLEEPSRVDGSTEVQDRSLLSRFKAAGVNVVLNASILGMGLLTSSGIPVTPPATADSRSEVQQSAALTPPDSTPPSPSLSPASKPKDHLPPTSDPSTSAKPSSSSPLQKWHPSPNLLRLACKRMSDRCKEASPPQRLEDVSIRWALDQWARIAARAGLGVSSSGGNGTSIGATVIGVTRIVELDETVKAWNDVLSGLGLNTKLSQSLTASREEGAQSPQQVVLRRREELLHLVSEKLWPALGEWRDYSWASPGEGWVNQPLADGNTDTGSD